jgi:flagellar basal-body rod protein FlgF
VKLVPEHLETSNVNITEQLVLSIEDQRQYEINIKLINSAAEVDEGGATLLRLPN